jgi:hypothetical protein
MMPPNSLCMLFQARDLAEPVYHNHNMEYMALICCSSGKRSFKDYYSIAAMRLLVTRQKDSCNAIPKRLMPIYQR